MTVDQARDKARILQTQASALVTAANTAVAQGQTDVDVAAALQGMDDDARASFQATIDAAP